MTPQTRGMHVQMRCFARPQVNVQIAGSRCDCGNQGWSAINGHQEEGENRPHKEGLGDVAGTSTWFVDIFIFGILHGISSRHGTGLSSVEGMVHGAYSSGLHCTGCGSPCSPIPVFRRAPKNDLDGIRPGRGSGRLLLLYVQHSGRILQANFALCRGR